MKLIEARCDHLHLGCGLTTPDNWLNVDGSFQVVLAKRPALKRLLIQTRILSPKQAEIPWNSNVVRINLARKLPFRSGSFEVIYCSHLLEHLYYVDAFALLRDCHRILRIGGVCRFVVPDLESLVHRYVAAKKGGDVNASNQLMDGLLVHDRSRRSGLMGLFYRFTGYHQHKWMYDDTSLVSLFQEAGFTNAKVVGFLESQISRVAEVEQAGRVLDGEGIIVEATKD